MYSATLSTLVPLLVHHPSHVSPQTGHLACNNAPRQRNQLLIEKFADLATKLLRRYVKRDGSPDYEKRAEAARKLAELDGRRSQAPGPSAVRIYMSDPGEHWAPDKCPGCGTMLVDAPKGDSDEKRAADPRIVKADGV